MAAISSRDPGDIVFDMDSQNGFDIRHRRTRSNIVTKVPKFPNPSDYQTYTEFLSAAECWSRQISSTHISHSILPVPIIASYHRPSLQMTDPKMKVTLSPKNLIELQDIILSGRSIDDEETFKDLAPGRREIPLKLFIKNYKHQLLPQEPVIQLYDSYESYSLAEHAWVENCLKQDLPPSIEEIGDRIGIEKVARTESVQLIPPVSASLNPSLERFKGLSFSKTSAVCILIAEANPRVLASDPCPLPDLEAFGPIGKIQKPLPKPVTCERSDLEFPTCLLWNIDEQEFISCTKEFRFEKRILPESLSKFMNLYHSGCKTTSLLFAHVIRRLLESSTGNMYVNVILRDVVLLRKILIMLRDAGKIETEPLFYMRKFSNDRVGKEPHPLDELSDKLISCGLLYTLKTVCEKWNLYEVSEIVCNHLFIKCGVAVECLAANLKTVKESFVFENNGFFRSISSRGLGISVEDKHQSISPKRHIQRVDPFMAGNLSSMPVPDSSEEQCMPVMRHKKRFVGVGTDETCQEPEKHRKRTFRILLFVITFPYPQFQHALFGDSMIDFFNEIDAVDSLHRDKLRYAFLHSKCYERFVGSVLTFDPHRINEGMAPFLTSMIYSLMNRKLATYDRIFDIIKEFDSQQMKSRKESIQNWVFPVLPSLTALYCDPRSAITFSKFHRDRDVAVSIMLVMLSRTYERSHRNTRPHILRAIQNFVPTRDLTRKHLSEDFWNIIFADMTSGAPWSWEFMATLFQFGETSVLSDDISNKFCSIFSASNHKSSVNDKIRVVAGIGQLLMRANDVGRVFMNEMFASGTLFRAGFLAISTWLVEKEKEPKNANWVNQYIIIHKSLREKPDTDNITQTIAMIPRIITGTK